MTVARDYLDGSRPRHHLARELFALARSGKVELAAAPQGYRLDVKGGLAEQLRTSFSDEGVSQARQLSYPSEVTFPGPDLFPGAFVPGFVEAWNSIAATWSNAPKGADRMHVESHVWERRDVFLTDDQNLLTMCRRLRDEHGIEIEAMGLEEYLEHRRSAA